MHIYQVPNNPKNHRPTRSFSPLHYLLMIFIIIICMFIGSLTAPAPLTLVNDYTIPDFPKLENLLSTNYGQWAVAVDGNVVATSDENATPQPTASTAKMILALTVMNKKPFKLGDPGETITISQSNYDLYQQYVANGGSTTAVAVGAEYTEYEALAATLIASSNNMADTLAIWAFGSLDAYRSQAEILLAALGLTHTTISIDASGFNPSTTSTASDLAIIAREVMVNPVLAQIVNTKSINIPVAGTITNTNQLLGQDDIAGVKTGWIGEPSGYCLALGYKIADPTGPEYISPINSLLDTNSTPSTDHIITTVLLGAPTRGTSFDDSLALIQKLQSILVPTTLAQQDQIVGYYQGWWTTPIPIRAKDTRSTLGYQTPTSPQPTAYFGSNKSSFDPAIVDAISSDDTDTDVLPASDPNDHQFSPVSLLLVEHNHQTTPIHVSTADFAEQPSLWQRFLHVFGWQADQTIPSTSNSTSTQSASDATDNIEVVTTDADTTATTTTTPTATASAPEVIFTPITSAPSSNCTVKYGYLMLINPNFTVDTNFISARRSELISLQSTYGIVEGNAYNGDNLLDAEAASHLNDLAKAYEATYSGHTLETRSCFRSVGTNCGRLCAATGASDHHTGLTCDLLDPFYGTSLDTDEYAQHVDWQWLHENSYKYGFIDRFPEAWAGGSMLEPLNVDENGSTGLYETWHFRYVGIGPATEIATGKYNNGAYDSLEHYLKARGLVSDLKNGSC